MHVFFKHNSIQTRKNKTTLRRAHSWTQPQMQDAPCDKDYQIEKQNKHFATLQADEETQCDHQSSIYSLQQIFVYKVKKQAYLVHACMFTLA